MAGILVIGEVLADGTLTKLSTEVATLARALGEAGGGAVRGIVAGAGAVAEAAGATLAGFVPSVAIVRDLPADATSSGLAAALADAASAADIVLLPASPDGRDLAGALSVLTSRGVLANATGARWTDEGPVTEHSVFGGKLITEGAFASGQGLITVRPNAVTAEPLATPGEVGEAGAAAGTAAGTAASHDGGAVRLVERLGAETSAASIDDARVIVAGGRGVGGPDGFGLIRDLAEALGGAVGATRAAVDSGWIPYSQQIGQTGKIVKPQLYLAMGISGAIQHKVGMQTADTIVAVNRDADAPIADFADMVVVGDLFEVGSALLEQLRMRSS